MVRIEEHIARNSICEQAYNHVMQFHNAWRIGNPYPRGEAEIEIPKWRSGIPQQEITVEMRAERDRIKKENKEIHDRHHAELADYHQREYEANRSFLLKLYSEEIVSLVIGEKPNFWGQEFLGRTYSIKTMYLEQN